MVPAFGFTPPHRRTWGAAVALCLLALLVGPVAGAEEPTDAAAPPCDPGASGSDQQRPPLRLAGVDRVATAVAVAGCGWASTEEVVLTGAGATADALAAGPLAAHRLAPLLLAPADGLPAVLVEELRRLGAHRAIVVGGPAAVGPEVEAELTALGLEVVRLAGDDRFATATAVAAAIGEDAGVTPRVVVTSASAADALAAGNLAQTAPLLLTGSATLPSVTRRALRRLGPQEVTVVGGTDAVSEAVLDELRTLGPKVTRVAGPDRYATALATLDASDAHGGPVLVLASGAGIGDALPAGALAARLGSRLMLAPHRRLAPSYEQELRARVEPARGLALVGGRQALGDWVQRQAGAALAGDPVPAFAGDVVALDAATREEMTGVSWRPGCPVGMDDLALVRVDHWDLSEQPRRGRIVVAAAVAEDVLGVFARLFDHDVALEYVDLVDVHGADDTRVMAANTTTGFNCRPVAGTDRWSAHAYGTAIDVNPVQNPYVTGSTVQPEAGRAYLDRTDVRPGMAVEGGPIVRAFADVGWAWGADFATADDFQHFSLTGR